jgi:hypothetical protein
VTRKADFNAEEWETIVQGPPLAGLRVIGADRGGTLRESVSMAETYAEARREHGDSELLDELVASAPALDPARLASPEALQSLTAERLREALGILHEKTTEEDVEAYKRFVLTLVDRVARAHKEGGFLGIGGKQISDSEQQALDEIAAILSEPPS